MNGQQRHWEKMFKENARMFGKKPSYPARKAAKAFSKEKVKTILELGSGQGQDTMFFTRCGFEISALDYSEEGLRVIRREAEFSGLSTPVTTV